MAFGSIVQHGSNSGVGVTSLALTMAAASNPLIICVGVTSGTTGRVSSISQTGVTWTRINQAANTTAECEVWVGVLTAATSGTTATINFAASLTVQAQFMEVQLLANSSTVDTSANRTDSNPNAILSASVTTTNANDFLVAAFVVDSTTGLISPTNSFTIEDDLTTLPHLCVCYRVVSATGTYNTTLSWNGATPISYNFASVVVAFKQAAVSYGVVAGSLGW